MDEDGLVLVGRIANLPKYFEEPRIQNQLLQQKYIKLWRKISI